MREVLEEIETWRKQGKPVALETNVRKDGVVLRPLCAKMAMTIGDPPAGTRMEPEIAGSVTGGCIEGVVYEEAQVVLKNGEPKLLHYGVTSEETPWEVGLSCGGSLDVFVESLDSPQWRALYPTVKTCLEENQLAAVATILTGERTGGKMLIRPDGHILGSLGVERMEAEVIHWALEQMGSQESGCRSFGAVDVFVDVLPPPSRMIVIGAVHIAIPLVKLAKTLGYHTMVIDPRRAFATHERFPHADELVAEWPSTALEKLRLDESTYIVVISHDEKLDNPALKVALTNPTRYVGVLGSRRNLGRRFANLRDLGVTDEQLARLRAPIGMHLGAVSPEEIALSILAEMVAAKHEVLEHPRIRPAVAV